MALFNCPECQSKISDQSLYCIHCGLPIGNGAKNLLIRARIYLEDEEYLRAEELIEKALEQEPRSAKAYLLKLLTSLEVRGEKEMIQRVQKPLTDFKDYNRAVKFAPEQDLKILQKYNREVLERFENEEKEKTYQKAQNLKEKAVREEDYLEAAQSFENISEYNDALELSRTCRATAEELKKEEIYQEALEKMELGKRKDKEEASGLYIKASELFKGIGRYKEADVLQKECEKLGEKIGADYLRALLKKRKRKKLLKKGLLFSGGMLVSAIIIFGILTNFTYSRDVYIRLLLGQEEYLWQEMMEQIKNWFAYASGKL